MTQLRATRPSRRPSALLSTLALVATVAVLPPGPVAPSPLHAQAAGPPPTVRAAAPPAGALFLHTERFELEDGSYGSVDRGLLFVPQDRSRPDAGVLAVVFHRFPADDSVRDATPPVFQLRGGPGFGGLELEEPGYYEENVQLFTAFADVVIVGQRGFGPSRPDTECQGVRGSIFDPAVTEEDRGEALRRASRECRKYWAARGLRLQGFNVREAAADVADVARALGYPQIVLSGGSFGSHWGMTILRYHPDIVARALLTGMEGPDHTYDHPGWILNALERVAEDAESSPELRPWIPEDGIIAALRDRIQRIERDSPTITLQHPETGQEHQITVTADMLRSVTDGYSPTPDSLHDMAAWPSDILHLAAGRFEEVAPRALPDPGAKDEWTRIPNAAFFLLDCASGITDERAEEHFTDPALEVVGDQAWTYRTACPEWGVDLGDEFRTGFRTDVPTLVVHGNWDLSTPYENALELMPSFTNGRLVTVERGTHGALGEAMRASGSFRSQVLHFLRTGEMDGMPERVTLPRVNWVVPADLPPAGDRR